MKKGLIVLPLIAIAMTLPAVDAINGYISGSTVYVIYDADEGTFSDGLNMKSFAVRKGIAWNRRNAREMPDADPTPIEDQMQFDKWYYNGHLIEDSFIIDRDIRVTANYVAGTSTGDFQKDSWPVLAKVISDGGADPIAKLHETYNVSTLVGETKTIKFNNQDYTVRVIGEGQDFQTYNEGGATKEEQYTNPVALTFEFVNTFDEIPFSFNEETNRYKNSFIADFLNNDVFNLFDKRASRYMKSVYKCTNVGDGTSGPGSSAGELEPVLSKVFPISLKELNAEAYIEKATTEHASEYTYDFPYAIEEESGRDGNTGAYAYYKNTELPSLVKTNVNGTPVPYWTRSPEVESYDWVWHINKDGEIGDPDYGTIGAYDEQIPNFVQDSISVCPCFCY